MYKRVYLIANAPSEKQTTNKASKQAASKQSKQQLTLSKQIKSRQSKAKQSEAKQSKHPPQTTESNKDNLLQNNLLLTHT